MLGFEQYGGPEVQGSFEVEVPEPGPGQVVARMRAAGVNPADIKVREGMRQGKVEVRFPMAMGREAAGTVVAVGSGVEHLVLGDEVFGATASGTGGLAEYVVLDAAGTARRPKQLSPAQAACIPVALGTAYDAFDQMGLAAGQTLLVLGAGGGVGSAACQLARNRALRVLGVASEAKAQIVRDLGAEFVASGRGWSDQIRALSPEGVDGVLDMVGDQVVTEAASLLAPGAPLVSVASPQLASELGGSGVTRRRTSEVFAQVADLVVTGAVEPLISASYPFAQAEAAIAQVETGHAVGKVVVLADTESPD